MDYCFLPKCLTIIAISIWSTISYMDTVVNPKVSWTFQHATCTEISAGFSSIRFYCWLFHPLHRWYVKTISKETIWDCEFHWSESERNHPEPSLQLSAWRCHEDQKLLSQNKINKWKQIVGAVLHWFQRHVWCCCHFCSPLTWHWDFLQTIVADEETVLSATVTVLLFTTGCAVSHVVESQTDAYLDLDSVWNVNVDRWLGDVHWVDVE